MPDKQIGLSMTKQHKYWSFLVVFLFTFALLNGTHLLAASAAKQLAKGISLYNNNKNEDAIEYFVDVLVNGNQEEVATANKYINLIHEQAGGIQKPVEVDVNFKEGEVKTLKQNTDESVAAAQEQALRQAEQAALLASEQEQAALAAAQAQKQAAIDEVNAQQQDLANRIEAARLEAVNQAEAQRQAALEQTADFNKANVEAATAAAAAGAITTAAALQQDAKDTQTQEPENAMEENATLEPSVLNEQAQEPVAPEVVLVKASTETVSAPSESLPKSIFEDLTSPEAVKARELYTMQKLDSMTAAAIAKINDAKGVNLYMRDNRPDALDIEPGVIFEKGQFRQDSLPLLNSIYELLALTQGSAYVILPPGSYTDDVTLAGIRQAMALNSYLVSRGISQGKLHYNMGLSDEEPPAQYANLHGLAIVFDYDAKLPTNLEKNENNETAPLLSMAIVPLCHAIDRSLGEAFAIDFSVLETVSAIDNWVLQIVQHGRDGKYYVVRQLEGFTPVYHQILWNGRKGIIGPELPCGKYTVVLTATDLKGQKQTIRRRLIVKCASDTVTDTCSDVCGNKKAAVVVSEGVLDYKAARLWKKPARTMRGAASSVKATSQAVSTSSSRATKTTTTRTIIQEEAGGDDSGVAALPSASTSVDTTKNITYDSPDMGYPTNNPYDMPFEEN